MDLYLIRHADAVALGEGIAGDAERPLSEQGREQARLAGKALERHGIRLDGLVTSPLLRARQTAELIREDLSLKPEVTVCEDLAPDGKPRKVAKFLRKLKGEQIAAIGHMPQLSEMAGWLLGSRKASIDFAKASVACVECADTLTKGCGALLWLVTLEWMSGGDSEPVA